MTASDFVVPPPPTAYAPVAGGGRFPVRRIFCIGRNYGAHVREMGGDPSEQPPIFFTKPADAVWIDGRDVPYPPGTDDLHHEIELVLALGRGGTDLSAASAMECVWGFAAGVDLTRRDLQNAAKDRGQPWDSSKAFDASAPIGPIRRRRAGETPTGAIRLSVNGRMRQEARLEDMIWPPGEILAALSRLWRLEPGDLVFTGTPDGVGPLVRGDQVEGEVEEVGRVAFRVS